MSSSVFNSYPSCLPVKGRLLPRVSSGLSQGRHTKSNIHAHIHTEGKSGVANLPVLECMFSVSVEARVHAEKKFFFYLSYLTAFYPVTAQEWPCCFVSPTKTWRLGVKWADSRGSNFSCTKVGTSFKLVIAYTRASSASLILERLESSLSTHEACDVLLLFL